MRSDSVRGFRRWSSVHDHQQEKKIPIVSIDQVSPIMTRSNTVKLHNRGGNTSDMADQKGAGIFTVAAKNRGHNGSHSLSTLPQPGTSLTPARALEALRSGRRRLLQFGTRRSQKDNSSSDSLGEASRGDDHVTLRDELSSDNTCTPASLGFGTYGDNLLSAKTHRHCSAPITATDVQQRDETKAAGSKQETTGIDEKTSKDASIQEKFLDGDDAMSIALILRAMESGQDEELRDNRSRSTISVNFFFFFF